MERTEIDPDEFDELSDKISLMMDGYLIEDCLRILGRLTNNMLHVLPESDRIDSMKDWVQNLIECERELTQQDIENRKLH